jgi:hypothetical protein
MQAMFSAGLGRVSIFFSSPSLIPLEKKITQCFFQWPAYLLFLRLPSTMLSAQQNFQG